MSKAKKTAKKAATPKAAKIYKVKKMFEGGVRAEFMKAIPVAEMFEVWRAKMYSARIPTNGTARVQEPLIEHNVKTIDRQ
jgi:hypothetical protein